MSEPAHRIPREIIDVIIETRKEMLQIERDKVRDMYSEVLQELTTTIGVARYAMRVMALDKEVTTLFCSTLNNYGLYQVIRAFRDMETVG